MRLTNFRKLKSSGLLGWRDEQTTHQYVEKVTIEPTIPPEPHLILYNKVPKCGSTTFSSLIHNISHTNNFTFTTQNVFRGQSVSKTQEVILMIRVCEDLFLANAII